MSVVFLMTNITERLMSLDILQPNTQGEKQSQSDITVTLLLSLYVKKAWHNKVAVQYIMHLKLLHFIATVVNAGYSALYWSYLHQWNYQ